MNHQVEPPDRVSDVTVELHGVFTMFELQQISRRMGGKLDWDTVGLILVLLFMFTMAFSLIVYAVKWVPPEVIHAG